MTICVHQPSTPPALTKPDSSAQACVRGSLENWVKVQYFSTKPCWPIWAVWVRYFPQTLHSKLKPFIPEILFSTPLTDSNVATCCPLSFYHSPRLLWFYLSECVAVFACFHFCFASHYLVSFITVSRWAEGSPRSYFPMCMKHFAISLLQNFFSLIKRQDTRLVLKFASPSRLWFIRQICW